jgi:hypothetical protein
MRLFFSVFVLFLLTSYWSFGQILVSNSITGSSPNVSNPYNVGQVTDPNITATGIGRGNGILGVNANHRYDAKSWNSADLDPNAYFEFTLTPNADKKIDFISFEYTGQSSNLGPTAFAFRSSTDGFTSNIGSVADLGGVVSLSSSVFQNITGSITFRLYAWAAPNGNGTFSVNDFEFKGTTSCYVPQTPDLQETTFSCTATSFNVSWSASINVSNYHIDVATDQDFIKYLDGYQNRELAAVESESVSGLHAGGTYYVRLHAVNSCASSGFSNSIKVAPPETVYTGVWSNGFPDANTNVRFSSDYLMDNDVEACSCTIDTGIAVQVDSGVVLKLENGLDVSGFLTFENNASLVQVNDAAVNTGAIVYKRNSEPMKNFDYTYWSSPVKRQQLNVLSPNTLSDKYFSYSMDNWIGEEGSNPMDPPGKGFIIRVPKPHFWPDPLASSYVQPVEFKGIPNNGKYELPIDPEGYGNLIGNPYPSALSADEFLLENSINNPRLDGTIRFWTHNTGIDNNEYSDNDFASYNRLGGIAASSGGEKPVGTVAAGQSFFVLSSSSAGPVIFNNAMRISESGSNQQFFKGRKPKPIKRHRIWLNLTSAKGAFKQLLLGYVTGATNEFDPSFDGVSIDNESDIDFFSISNGSNLTIQGRALPFKLTDKVPLGFITAVDGQFEIKLDQVDGLFADQSIYLEDKKTGVIHDLKKSAYSFTASKGTVNKRFVLRYLPFQKFDSKPENSLNPKNKIKIFVQENQLHVVAVSGDISAVFVYNLKGVLLYQKEHINSDWVILSDLSPKKQILILKTVFKDGSSCTNKLEY